MLRYPVFLRISIKFILILWTSVSFLYPTYASMHIPPIFRKYERIYNIPHGLLEAISLNESGQSKSGKFMVNPWAVNVQGKGYHFKSKHEAIRAVRQFQMAGYESIDVGCMQINLKHHPRAFKSLDYAFDPEHNINYAGKFLSLLKERFGNWNAAIAHYHSHTQALHRPYQKKVLKIWNQLNKTLSPYTYEAFTPLQHQAKHPQVEKVPYKTTFEKFVYKPLKSFTRTIGNIPLKNKPAPGQIRQPRHNLLITSLAKTPRFVRH